MKKIFFIALTTILILAIYLIQNNGVKILRVVTSSMEPEIKRGALVLVIRSDKYSIGDILSYKSNSEVTTVTHRIIKISKIGDNYLFVTKGDSNEFEDSNPVSAKDIVGKVIFTVPLSYTLFDNALTSKLVFMLCMFLQGFLLGKLSKKLLKGRNIEQGIF